MKAIIAGGRNFEPEDKHAEWLVKLLEELEIDTVLSGCATGADSFGEGVAYSLRIKVKEYPANWMKYGNKAGPIRNEQMAKNADVLILFPGGRGTADMERRAVAHGLAIYKWADHESKTNKE
jgi:predicted Rossmann-fold nucleotide-binding protein